MIKSLSSGVAGLNANAEAMGIIGDNIANVKTVAFKTTSISFANLLSQSLGGSSSGVIGSGSKVWDTSKSWLQGAPENTGNGTDLSVNGSGFFMAKNSSGGTYYTRAGQFSFDKDGNLVNPDGLLIQGYSVSETGTLGSIGNIQISTGSASPQATSELSIYLNLDSKASIGPPAETYSTSMTIYDSLGASRVLQFTFSPDSTPAAGTTRSWTWTATFVPATVGQIGTPTGQVGFNGNGALVFPLTNPILTITGLPNGATIGPVKANPPTIPADVPNGILWSLIGGNITGYSSPSAVTSQTQDGYPSGSLKSVSVDEKGFVSGVYSNGEIKPLYQISLANFSNYGGLTPQGNNLYAESLTSGTPTIGTAGTGVMGTITPGALEMSNVDLSTEFVNLITTQRAYQANAKVITTSDEILGELMNLKR